MSSSLQLAKQVVVWLRAAGEPTRLRLLALCAERELSVSDLAKAVRQSEPRVSRHLKILSAAGLVNRLRQGQWVHYQVVQDQAAAGFVQGLLAQLDRGEPVLARDRQSLRGSSSSAHATGVPTRLGRALRAFMEGTESSAAPIDSALVIGVDHPDLLSAAARTAKRCVAIAHSRRSAQAIRAFAEGENLNCRVVQASGDMLTQRDTEKAGQPFDAIVLERVSVGPADLARELSVVRQALVPTGRLWLFERYDSLENPRARVVEHPIARVRRILGEAGFSCEKLGPIEADGEHVLAACAVERKTNMRVA